MIDFDTKQLSWALIGLATAGGTGYLGINSAIHELDKKAVITQTKTENIENKLVDISKQLTRLEDKLDKQNLPSKGK